MKPKQPMEKGARWQTALVAQAAVCLLLMLVTQWRMALPVIGTAVVVLFWIQIARRRERRCAVAQSEACKQLQRYVQEAGQGHDAVRLSRATRQTKEHFRELNGAVYSASRRVQFARAMQKVLLGLMGKLEFVLVTICGFDLVMQGLVSAGTAVAFLLYAGWLAVTLNRLSRSWFTDHHI